MSTSMTFGLLDYGVIFGIYNMLFQVSNAIGPCIGGCIFDRMGSYFIAFWLSLVLYAITVPCMLLVCRPRTKQT